MTPALELHNLTRCYRKGDAPAVQDLDLEIQSGELLAMVGESGSGKTTLLRLISGLEKPDQGEIRVHGDLVSSPDTWVPPDRRQVGLVFQDGALFPHLTIQQNVAYGLKGTPKNESRSRVDALLALVGLDGYQRRYPHELSGGERQRIAVIRALAPEPAVVLFDEPFSNLDPMLRSDIRDHIRGILKEVQATAILVTHDTDDALHVGDRVAIVHQGSIDQIGTPAEVYHHPSNGYCAKLFGAANSVDGVWRRPEDMQLLPAYEPGCHPVLIETSVDAGRHREVRVRPKADEHEAYWTLYETGAEWVKPGSPAWVRVQDLPT